MPTLTLKETRGKYSIKWLNEKPLNCGEVALEEIRGEERRSEKRRDEENKERRQKFGRSCSGKGGALKSPPENRGEFCLLVLHRIPSAHFMGTNREKGGNKAPICREKSFELNEKQIFEQMEKFCAVS